MSEQETADRINGLLAEMPQESAARLVQQLHQDAARVAAQANERHRLRLDRVEAAFTEHYRSEHPQALEEIHETPGPSAS